MKATHIVVVQTGWVFVGTLVPRADKAVIQLDNAACVRIWGTAKGLGELALAGPTNKTVLDPCGTVEIVSTAALFAIPVATAKWR